MKTMREVLKRLAGGMFVGTVLAAQPAMAETINMICKFQSYGGYSDMEVIWADTSTNVVSSVLSLQNRPGMHGLNGGANVDDALAHTKYPRLFRHWPATITATSIKWTEDGGTPRPSEINRATGTLVWSTPEDPTPPDHGTAQCEKGNLAVPATPQVAPSPAVPH